MKIMDLGDLSDFPVETLRKLADADLERIQRHEQRLVELVKRRDKVCEEIKGRSNAERITCADCGQSVTGTSNPWRVPHLPTCKSTRATEDLRIFEVRTSSDTYDLNASEMAAVEAGRTDGPDKLADVLALEVGEKVKLGTFIVVTRKPDRDREGMAEAGPDPRREAFE